MTEELWLLWYPFVAPCVLKMSTKWKCHQDNMSVWTVCTDPLQGVYIFFGLIFALKHRLSRTFLNRFMYQQSVFEQKIRMKCDFFSSENYIFTAEKSSVEYIAWTCLRNLTMFSASDPMSGIHFYLKSFTFHTRFCSKSLTVDGSTGVQIAIFLKKKNRKRLWTVLK